MLYIHTHACLQACVCVYNKLCMQVPSLSVCVKRQTASCTQVLVSVHVYGIISCADVSVNTYMYTFLRVRIHNIYIYA